jgi:hypothetical protein
MSVSYETIRERSIAWLREHKPEWPHSWTREIRVDPDECIVDDDDGHLWVLPFATDGAGMISFASRLRALEPVQLRHGDPVAAVPYETIWERSTVAASRVVASFARDLELKLDEDGLLPPHLSLISDAQRCELRARLRMGA